MANQNLGFKKVQKEFIAHLKDPDHYIAPKNIEDRRMEIYRSLFYRNIQNFIASAYPVLRKLYNNDDWHNMVRDFYSTHKSKSPYFKDISNEFLEYLKNERKPQPEDPVFIKELAHYEWIEIYLTFLDIEPDFTQIDPVGNLVDGIPVLSPLAQLHSYQYPVHKISPKFQPEQPNTQPTFLMVYRDLQDAVGFIELNAVTAMLIELIENNKTNSGEQLFNVVAEILKHTNPDIIYQEGTLILDQLRKKDILLGTIN